VRFAKYREANPMGQSSTASPAPARVHCSFALRQILPSATWFSHSNRQRAPSFFDIRDKNFAISNFTRPRGLDDDFRRSLRVLVRHDQINFDLRQKIHRVFATAVGFRMSVLPAKALHFTNGHPINADLPQGVLDFIQFGKFDNRFNFFHTFSTVSFNHSTTLAFV